MDAYDQFLARYAPEVQAISRRLRTLVKRAMPGAHEVLVDRHNHIGYDYTPAPRDRIVYICPMTDYVRLGFMYGAHLNDPQQLLVGEGQRLRHIKVRSLKEAANPALRPLVEAAWAEAAGRVQSQSAGRK